MLDIFNSDAFSTVSLTDAINILPYKPNRIGSLGLFTPKGITTTTAVIEEKDGVLSLLPTRARGSAGVMGTVSKRRARSFLIPHIPHDDAVLADEVQNVRAFGSETALQTVSALVNEKLATMRQNHEVTHEYHRIGAINGVVLDADGSSVIYNFFTEFGVTEQTQAFDFTTPGDMKATCTALKRKVENALGMAPYTRLRAFCGDTFWDAFIANDEVKTAYERWQNGEFLRSDQRDQGGFEIFGIFWENYRGSVGGVDFFPDTIARFVPEGVPNLFRHYSAPADFMETVNTIGKPVYTKQERMKYDKGVELHSQSNPLIICLRPRALVKGTMS